MKISIETYAETGFTVPRLSDNYTVQRIGNKFHVVNPDAVVIGECDLRMAAVEYANKQNTAKGLRLVK